MQTPEMRLSTGQTIRLNEGRVEVLPPPLRYHYRLVAQNPLSNEISAHAARYDDLIPFLKQLEELGYQLHSLERVPGDK